MVRQVGFEPTMSWKWICLKGRGVRPDYANWRMITNYAIHLLSLRHCCRWCYYPISFLEKSIDNFGRAGGTRTHTPIKEKDFKSFMSSRFITAPLSRNWWVHSVLPRVLSVKSGLLATCRALDPTPSLFLPFGQTRILARGSRVSFDGVIVRFSLTSPQL